MAASGAPLWAVCVLRLALATVYFQEEFLDGERWRNRWVQSTNDSQLGHFRLSSGKFYGHKEKDKGLQTTQNGRFYAISARFKPFSNKGKTLVIQYTVKHEQKMDCGGGYIKVFPADVDQKNLNGKSQYYIMFGPDICGFDIKKVHVILHFKNQYHSNKKSIRCKVDGFTHLYTLILRPDLTYEVKIDSQSIEAGSIEYDWNLTSLKKMEKSSAESKDWAQAKDDKSQVFLKPEVRNQGVRRGHTPEWSRGGACLAPSGFFWLLAFLGLWPHRFNLCLHLHVASSSSVSLLSLIKTLPLDLQPTWIIQNDLSQDPYLNYILTLIKLKKDWVFFPK
ncbi:calreticulin-3 isoform X2 [Equus quagga]|uniref:calreticulin-3 isoform X2 n=1 Tax=Equus quagga TaxID=89248 RepID=UPI001EE2B87D|nr:calreticulin-3 isoform X2 [Equus quagga]